MYHTVKQPKVIEESVIDHIECDKCHKYFSEDDFIWRNNDRFTKFSIKKSIFIDYNDGDCDWEHEWIDLCPSCRDECIDLLASHWFILHDIS